MSQSISRVLCFCCAWAIAKWTAVVVLPSEGVALVTMSDLRRRSKVPRRMELRSVRTASSYPVTLCFLLGGSGTFGGQHRSVPVRRCGPRSGGGARTSPWAGCPSLRS